MQKSVEDLTAQNVALQATRILDVHVPQSGILSYTNDCSSVNPENKEDHSHTGAQ